MCPVLDISSSEQVPRSREGRDPHSVDQTRVLTDVIEVQVRADDHVDRLGVRVEPGRSKVREKRPLLVIKVRDQRTVLRVARTCVNHNASPIGLDVKGVLAVTSGLMLADADAAGSWFGGKPTRTAGAWAPRSGSGAAALSV